MTTDTAARLRLARFARAFNFEALDYLHPFDRRTVINTALYSSKFTGCVSFPQIPQRIGYHNTVLPPEPTNFV